MMKSNIQWIGEYPNSWKLDRLSWHMTEINEKNNPIKTTKILSLTNKLGVVPYEEKGNQGNVAKENYDEYKLAYPNTIVANSMNILIGSVGKCDYFGCVSPVYYVFKPNKNENIDFLNYIFQTEQFQKELRCYANGILEIRLRLSSNDIIKREIPYPPLPIQNKIVAVLNDKTSKIDALIENENKQIEKLEEYRKAVITKAVTKGLDPNAKMKDSGVEWVGNIPEGWEVKKLKYCFESKVKKYSFGDYPYIALENVESFSGQYVFTETNENYNLKDSLLASKDDVVFGKLRPYLAKAYLVLEPSCVSSEFAVFGAENGSNTRYLKYLFLSLGFIDVINSSTYGTKMPRANLGFIDNLYIAIPSNDEQGKIADFLDKKCCEIQNAILLKKSKTEKLQQYKKSLIYEYVTGKKAVEA